MKVTKGPLHGFTQTKLAPCKKCNTARYVTWSWRVYGDLYTLYYYLCLKCKRKAHETIYLADAITLWNEEQED